MGGGSFGSSMFLKNSRVRSKPPYYGERAGGGDAAIYEFLNFSPACLPSPFPFFPSQEPSGGKSTKLAESFPCLRCRLSGLSERQSWSNVLLSPRKLGDFSSWRAAVRYYYASYEGRFWPRVRFREGKDRSLSSWSLYCTLSVYARWSPKNGGHSVSNPTLGGKKLDLKKACVH